MTDSRIPTRLESEVMRMLLAGDHPVLAALRAQADTVRVVERELTGVGCFTTVAVDGPRVARDRLVIGDVTGTLPDGRALGFLLFVEDGRLHLLEGHSYHDGWPESFDQLVLTYHHVDRTRVLAALD